MLRKKTKKIFKRLHLIFLPFLFALTLTGCGYTNYAIPSQTDSTASKQSTPYDGIKYISESKLNTASEASAGMLNPYAKLNVPTDITKIGDLYFIVDCYHNQIIYHDNLHDPLQKWQVMTSEIKTGHTLASDGTVYLADDTGNNRVLVFEKKSDIFIHTQTFDKVGNKPHYIVYDKATDTFYCWSSFSGEMYLFRHMPNSTRMYLTEIRKVDQLANRYVRSFTISGNRIYFVSGLPTDGSVIKTASILCCDLSTFQILAEYPVPDSLAGMASIMPIQDYFYITVSTDLSGSQDAATIIRTHSLTDLSTGKYTDLYQEYFVGGGTPYYLGCIDGTFYLTEHRLQDHAIWQFHISDQNTLSDVLSLY